MSGSLAPLEMWAGVECTVNRVGDRYLDQLQFNGHAARVGDLELFAALGIAAIRYPVLWERIAADGPESTDWSWPDERLAKLRDLALRPIVGLCHHGSGPRDTSLIDPRFPEKLAAYAQAVARRYPWLEDFTPINEPLTTARFSGLYGHWYPHGRDDKTFVRALLTQCRAIVLSMAAIRRVTPHARLVLTEDFGRTFALPPLQYQADYENERRCLSFDLLFGRMRKGHPLWHYLLESGATEHELSFFLENPCPPDICGLNYYVTSDRFLDTQKERYPSWSYGGNRQLEYADVEAVRARTDGIAGFEYVLDTVWTRYQRAVALTEVHIGYCGREDQLRWLLEAWTAAESVRARGADVRAVTAWALLGTFDWNSLVTVERGFYEPGVFDLRGCHGPRPTALAGLIQSLATRGEHNHPVLVSPGWWRRAERLTYGPEGSAARVEDLSHVPSRTQAFVTVERRPIVITGATGTLGRAFARICSLRGLPFRLLSRADVDITDARALAEILDRLAPWAVVNAAGYVRVDDAEREPDRCARENTIGPGVLANTCAARDISLLTFSSDLVFDGDLQRPYCESDPVAPLGVYGQCKAAAEHTVQTRMPDALIVRSSAFFGPWDEHNFLAVALREISKRRPFRAAADAIVSPTYVPDLVNTSLDLLIDGEHGIWHLANRGAVSWAELATLAARGASLDPGLIESCSVRELGLAAPRPRFSALGSERGMLMPSLEEALAQYFAQLDAAA